MATDPICGMVVDEATALRADRDGKSYYFCSDHCRAKFEAGTGLQDEEHECRDHEPPSGTHDEREPVSQSRRAASDAAEVYTCPMHPEIEQDHPGSCPKCGMDLELKVAAAEDDGDAELWSMTRRFGAVPLATWCIHSNTNRQRRRQPTHTSPSAATCSNRRWLASTPI